MANYFICTRNIVDGNFANEPGKTSYLMVNEDAQVSMPTDSCSKDDFLKALLSNGDPEDIVIFIHGYNNSQQDVMIRHKELKEGLKDAGFKGELITFDWPSANKALMYLEDRHDAKVTALELVKSGITLLAKRQDNNCMINVHVIAHSTGSYIVHQAFSDADTTKPPAEINWTVSQLIFMAGDTSSESMTDYNGSSVYWHCNRLTNYYNPHDKVLAISNVKRAGFKNRVGRIGLPPDKSVKGVDVHCGDYFIKEIDNLNVRLGDKSHSWFFYSKVWYDDVYQTILGEQDRNVIPTRVKENGTLKLKTTENNFLT